jgi:hypothetical protein
MVFGGRGEGLTAQRVHSPPVEAHLIQCEAMPPCAQDDGNESPVPVEKKKALPLVTLEQLHEHKTPDDLWIGNVLC